MDIIALNYLGNIFDVANLLAMLLGVLVGLVIGAIPGLSPPMAIALMIPVSFQFPPETALILLVSCFAAGIYGGAFSAILLRAKHLWLVIPEFGETRSYGKQSQAGKFKISIKR